MSLALIAVKSLQLSVFLIVLLMMLPVGVNASEKIPHVKMVNRNAINLSSGKRFILLQIVLVKKIVWMVAMVVTIPCVIVR